MSQDPFDHIRRLDGRPATLGNLAGDVEIRDWQDASPTLVSYFKHGTPGATLGTSCLDLREVLAWCHKHRPDLIEATREVLPEEPEKVTAAEAVRADLHELRAAFLALSQLMPRGGDCLSVDALLDARDTVDAYRAKYK